MPGRHVTDQQMRLFMTLKQTNSIPVAAAKAGLSQATGYRLQCRLIQFCHPKRRLHGADGAQILFQTFSTPKCFLC